MLRVFFFTLSALGFVLQATKYVYLTSISLCVVCDLLNKSVYFRMDEIFRGVFLFIFQLLVFPTFFSVALFTPCV